MAKEIKNYLKSVKDVTAPLNWKSSPDSPPTQLAYVTKPEIDMLVKANIHGSMNGKPNMGPKGIISLDGGGSYAAETKTDKKPKGSSTGASQVNTGQSGGPAGMTFTESVSNPNIGVTQQEAQQQQIQNQNNQNNDVQGVIYTTDQFVNKEEEERKSLAQKGKDIAQGIMTNLMGGGEGGNLDLTKEEAYANLPTGMHPLRKQYEYLKEKYGPNWANTTQAKVLEGYLSGVPVERGGGLGAQDENYGLTGDEAKEFQNKLLLNDEFMDGQNYRNSLLRQVAGMTNTMGGQFDFSKIDPERASEGLSPEQYFNFRQQLMAADATPENQQYKSAFPFSSGSGLESLSRFIPGIGTLQTLAGGIFPERDLSGYQQNIDPIAAGFRALPVPDQSDSNEPVRRPGFMPIIPLPDPSQPERPRYPLPGDPKRPPFGPPFMPDGGNFPLPVGINAFNPMFLGPSFRRSPYTNRGVSPAFYEALSRFA